MKPPIKSRGICKSEFDFLLAKTYYLTGSPTSSINRYLSSSLLQNNFNALRFYALEYPKFSSLAESSADFNLFLEKSGDNVDTLFDLQSEIAFLFANIYAKNPEQRKINSHLAYLKLALNSGYHDSELFSHNFIVEHDSVGFYNILNELVPEDFLEYRIRQYVEARINEWQKKGKFEKTTT